jgi:hypothetical protein
MILRHCRAGIVGTWLYATDCREALCTGESQSKVFAGDKEPCTSSMISTLGGGPISVVPRCRSLGSRRVVVAFIDIHLERKPCSCYHNLHYHLSTLAASWMDFVVLHLTAFAAEPPRLSCLIHVAIGSHIQVLSQEHSPNSKGTLASWILRLIKTLLRKQQGPCPHHLWIAQDRFPHDCGRRPHVPNPGIPAHGTLRTVPRVNHSRIASIWRPGEVDWMSSKRVCQYGWITRLVWLIFYYPLPEEFFSWCWSTRATMFGQ